MVELTRVRKQGFEDPSRFLNTDEWWCRHLQPGWSVLRRSRKTCSLNLAALFLPLPLTQGQEVPALSLAAHLQSIPSLGVPNVPAGGLGSPPLSQPGIQC